jgi:DNA-binding GntR family transcriptional regulator
MSHAVSRAYEGIRGLIVRGEVLAGDQLRESRLAELLDVSRTPVREAMRRLETEGVIERRENRRSYVAEINPQDMAELYVVRASLESIAAGLAAERGGDELVRVLSTLVDDMDGVLAHKPVDYARLTTLNGDFHAALLTAAGNRLLAATAQGLMKRPLVSHTFRKYSSEELARSQAHHRELVAACASADSEWAESVMRSHILAAASIFRRSAPR